MWGDSILQGSLVALAVINAFFLFAGIYLGSAEVLIIGIINVFLLIWQYEKRKKELAENKVVEQKQFDAEKKMNLLKKQAEENIIKNYKHKNLSKEEINDLVREEILRLMIERK